MSKERDEFRKELYGVVDKYINRIDFCDVLGELYAILKQTEYLYGRELHRRDRGILPNPFEGEL
jgi:hypothetical protein